MPEVEFGGKKFLTDEEGFLRSYDDWSETWVEYVRRLESMGDLTEEHFRVIKVLQEHYKMTGTVPMVRMMARTTGFKLKHIYKLFPSGPGKGACKMAGLPKPVGCV